MKYPTEANYLNLEAEHIILEAEFSALLLHVVSISAALNKEGTKVPELGAAFIGIRKEYVHAKLDEIEAADPERAAKVLAVINTRPRTLPFDYE